MRANAGAHLVRRTPVARRCSSHRELDGRGDDHDGTNHGVESRLEKQRHFVASEDLAAFLEFADALGRKCRDARMRDRVECAPSFVVAENPRREFFSVELSRSVEDVRSEPRHDVREARRAASHDLPRQDVRVHDGQPSAPEALRYGALPRADPAGEAE